MAENNTPRNLQDAAIDLGGALAALGAGAPLPAGPSQGRLFLIQLPFIFWPAE